MHAAARLFPERDSDAPLPDVINLTTHEHGAKPDAKEKLEMNLS